MDIKYLDENGLKKVFEIVKEKDTKLENDVTLILNGIAQELEKKANKSDIPEISDADWDAEEGEAGFIKNKPVVEVEGENLIKIFSNINFTYSTNGYLVIGYGSDEYVIYNDLILGDKYKVIINDKEYVVECKTFNDRLYLSDEIYNGNPFVGNFNLYWSNNRADFYIKSSENTPVNVSISIYHIKTEIKQIDPSYLPIVQETGDSETSIMSQKAVTEALANVGVSTEVNADWDAEEGEEGFIKNKPVVEVESEELIFKQNNINFNNYDWADFLSYDIKFTNLGILFSQEYNVYIDNVKYTGFYFKNWGSSTAYFSNSQNPNNYEEGDCWSEGNYIRLPKSKFGDTNIHSIAINKVGDTIQQFNPKYLPIVQETGDSETSIMSQKAVTEALANVGGSNYISPYPANNQIIYFSIDGKKLELTSDSRWQDTVETIVSNEYDGCGVITFKEDLTVLPNMYKIFNDKNKVIELVLPNCITTFSDYQFQGMENLYTVNIPTNLTSLPQYCFDQCDSLYEIRLPKKIKEIPECCFGNCYSLSLINLDKIETINNRAFNNCSSISTVNLSSLKTFNGNSQFYGCNSLSNLILVDTVDRCNLTSIPQYCFYGHNIKDLYIPSSIISINISAFYSVKKINSITIRSNTLFALDSIFGGDYDAIKYFVNGSMLEQYRNKYPSYYGLFYEIGYDYSTIVYHNQLWTGTQAEYDAIATKNSNTFYFIKEEE